MSDLSELVAQAKIDYRAALESPDSGQGAFPTESEYIAQRVREAGYSAIFTPTPLEVSKEEAQALIDRFMEAYPRWAELFRRAQEGQS